MIGDNQKLLREKEHLQKVVLQYQNQVAAQEEELKRLRVVSERKELTQTYAANTDVATTRGVSKSLFFVLLIFTIGLAAFSAYSLIKSSNSSQAQSTNSVLNSADTTANTGFSTKETERQTTEQQQAAHQQPKAEMPAPVDKRPTDATANTNDANDNNSQDNGTNSQEDQPKPNTTTNDNQNKNDNKQQNTDDAPEKYTVVSKAYFYNSPDESTRRDAFINHWNNAVLNPLDEKNGFIYIVFTNEQGQTSKGWLRKKDLKPLD